MLCKYCKKNTHLIDDCPEIICKKCRIVGHPFWKCKSTVKGFKKGGGSCGNGGKGVNKTNNQPVGIYRRNIFEDLDQNKPSKKKETPKESYASIIVSADNKIDYYLKFQNTKWSDLL